MNLQEFGVYDLMIRAIILMGVLFMAFGNFRAIRKNRIDNEKMTLLKYYNNFFIQNIPVYSTYIASILIGVGLFRVGSLLRVNMSSEPVMHFMNIELLGTQEILEYKVYIYAISIISAILFTFACIMYNLSELQLGLNFSLFIDIKEHYTLKTDRLYSIVRHPMYLFEMMMYLTASAALLSWALLAWSLIIHLPLLILRSRAEERLLEHYFGSKFMSYKDKVRGFLPVRK